MKKVFTSSCENIKRPFVLHSNHKPSPGSVIGYNNGDSHPVVTILIPTLDGSRDGYLPNLLSQIARQKFRAFEVLIIMGDPRQGRAINIGAALAKGRYLLTLDDDTSLPDTDTLSKLIRVLDNHPEIGAAGGNNIIPNNASAIVRRVMKEVPRRSWKIVREITDSDLAEHPCLMLRADDFRAIGGENELIPRGLDPYLRKQFREANRRVVVVPEVYYHHLPPGHFVGLIRQFFRNGKQAAYANIHYPEWIIQTPADHGPVKPTKSLSVRACQFPFKLAAAVFTGKPLLFLCELSYSFGFLSGLINHCVTTRPAPEGAS